MSSFKIYFDKDNIRRIRHPLSNFEEFVSKLQELYPNYHPELVIKYYDQEGDKIAVTTQLEWEEMLQELKKEEVIKIYVEEGNSDNYFKDGPKPQSLHFYSDVVTKEPLNNFGENLVNFASNVPKCLENLFRDKKIIPNAIPAFLKDALKVKYLDDHTADLDVDIPLLFDKLHEKAIEYLNTMDREMIQKGKDCLLSMVQLKPDNYVALYNLACAESLLNNVHEALQTLEKSVRAGYTKLEHMLSDPDLLNVRESEGFKKIVELVENMRNKDKSESDIQFSQTSSMNDSNYYQQVSMDSDIYTSEIQEDPVLLETNNFDSIIFEENMNDNSVKKEVDDVKEKSLTDSFADIRLKWAPKIELIRGMGFAVDDEVLSLLLEQTGGNHEQVVNLLLQKSQF